MKRRSILIVHKNNNGSSWTEKDEVRHVKTIIKSYINDLINMGHEVKLIAPQLVKLFVQGNRNDASNAEGLCETVSRPNMRFVPAKGLNHLCFGDGSVLERI